MQKGTVKWFNSQKGFGFITQENGEDLFVHYTGINSNGFKNLEEGQKVEYDIIDGEKGKQAVNVTKLQENKRFAHLLFAHFYVSEAIGVTACSFSQRGMEE